MRSAGSLDFEVTSGILIPSWRIIPVEMFRTDADKFLETAEECLREAEKAISPRDREAWLKLADDWMKLARSAKERGQ